MDKNNLDSSSDDDMPELEDMSQSLQKLSLKSKKINESRKNRITWWLDKAPEQKKKVKDYTKTVDQLEKERQREQDELDKRLAAAYLKSQKAAKKSKERSLTTIREETGGQEDNAHQVSES